MIRLSAKASPKSLRIDRVYAAIRSQTWQQPSSSFCFTDASPWSALLGMISDLRRQRRSPFRGIEHVASRIHSCNQTWIEVGFAFTSTGHGTECMITQLLILKLDVDVLLEL